MPDLKSIEQLPWQPQSYIRGNLAIGNLHHNVLNRLKNDRGVHAETALAVFGCIAGAAAQNAAWAEIKAGTRKPSDMIAAVTTSGERFFMGDLLNSYLLPQPGFDRLTLWPMACGAAILSGLDAAELPKVEPIFARIASTMGGPDFDWPDVPANHRPGIGVRQAVTAVWPFAKQILQLDPPPGVAAQEPLLTEQHWAVISAMVACGMLKKVKDVIAPKIALAILMHTAIAASKVPLPAA